MTEQEILKLAEPIIKNVVNMLAEKRYDELEKIVELNAVSADILCDMVEEYLKINGFPYIDKYGVSCNFTPPNQYRQLSCILYSNGSGFHVNYDLTTDSELNDLTLQMKFQFGEPMKAEILDIHVM